MTPTRVKSGATEDLEQNRKYFDWLAAFELLCRYLLKPLNISTHS
jgi:hypothetical protein